MSEREVYLGLGSNLGDRERLLGQAIERLGRSVQGLHCASLYETEPLDGAGPGRFLNTVAAGWTALGAEPLLEEINRIEAALGRVRLPPGGKAPRGIDIDLLLLGDLVRTGAPPELPHPRMHLRQFVLIPLLEIAPALADPVTGVAYRRRLDELPDQGVTLFRARR